MNKSTEVHKNDISIEEKGLQLLEKGNESGNSQQERLLKPNRQRFGYLKAFNEKMQIKATNNKFYIDEFRDRLNYRMAQKYRA
jgi:hypothetical protein